MTVKELCTSIGADYDAALRTFGTEKMLAKFLLRFPKDPTYSKLKEGYEKGDAEQIFGAVHDMKSVYGNYGLKRFQEIAVEVTEAYRPWHNAFQEELSGAKAKGTESEFDANDCLDRLVPRFAADVAARVDMPAIMEEITGMYENVITKIRQFEAEQ